TTATPTIAPPSAEAAPNQPSATYNVSQAWQRRFAMLEKFGAAGGYKRFMSSPELKAASFKEKFFAMSNIWAFLFGMFYYLCKGMWQRALVLFGFSCLYSTVLVCIEIAFGIKINASVYWAVPAAVMGRL